MILYKQNNSDMLIIPKVYLCKQLLLNIDQSPEFLCIITVT